MITYNSKPKSLQDKRKKNNVTATSVKQIPRLFKVAQFVPNTINLDLGTGKYNLASSYLRNRKVQNFRYDPYSLPFSVNQATACALSEASADTVTISNTLNVIKKKELRMELLKTAKKHLKKGGQCYGAYANASCSSISIYEGNKTGKGRKTEWGTYQANKCLAKYLPEVAQVFSRYTVFEGIIICKK